MRLSEQEVRSYLEKNGTGLYDLRLRTEYTFDPWFEAKKPTIIHESEKFFPLEERCFGGAFHGKERLDDQSFQLSWHERQLEIPYRAVLFIQKIRDLPRPTIEVRVMGYL